MLVAADFYRKCVKAVGLGPEAPAAVLGSIMPDAFCACGPPPTSAEW